MIPSKKVAMYAKYHSQELSGFTFSPNKLVILFLSFFIWTSNIYGQQTYEVVSTSMLNVRNKPSTKSSVIGKLKLREKVEVYSIDNLWAAIIYKDRKAYVSSKFLRKIETKEDSIENNAIEQESSTSVSAPQEEFAKEITPYRPKTKGKIGIDFIPTLYGGYVNLLSKNVSPKGNIGGGIDFSFQFIAKENIVFLPRNYYMETSLGYSLRGSGYFPLHYVMAKVSPIGYRLKISKIELYGNIGAYIGYTFSSIETNSHSFDSNIDWGVLGKIGLEYNKIGLGFSYERGLNNVCNSNLTLKNQGIFFNVSYRLFKLK